MFFSFSIRCIYDKLLNMMWARLLDELAPNPNILIPAAWNQTNAVRCHSQRCNTIVVSIQRTCSEITKLKIKYYRSNELDGENSLQHPYPCTMFSACPTCECCYRQSRKIHSDRCVIKLKWDEYLVFFFLEWRMSHKVATRTTRSESTVRIRRFVVGNLLIRSNIKETSRFIFWGCGKCLATWVILIHRKLKIIFIVITHWTISIESL